MVFIPIVIFFFLGGVSHCHIVGVDHNDLSSSVVLVAREDNLKCIFCVLFIQ